MWTSTHYTANENWNKCKIPRGNSEINKEQYGIINGIINQLYQKPIQNQIINPIVKKLALWYHQ